MKEYTVDVGIRGEGYSVRSVKIRAIDELDACVRAKRWYMLQVEAKVVAPKKGNANER